MNNLKKRFLSGVMGAALIFSAVAAPMTAGATKGPEYDLGISLKDSFSSKTTYTMLENLGLSDDGTNALFYYQKTIEAKTEGYVNYEKKHYVRAYIGQTSSNPLTVTWDSGRVYGYADVFASAYDRQTVALPFFPQLFFGRGYAYYGE